MVELRFYYGDEEEIYETHRGKNWEECCDDCASTCFDWEDDELEIREFTKITIIENGEEKDTTQEVREYFNDAVDVAIGKEEYGRT